MSCKDFRTKGMEDLTFYVVNNLRSQQMQTSFDLFRYDTVAEAVNKFREFPDNYASAIGCSFGGMHEIDLVQRVNNEPVKVMDFYNITDFNEREDVHAAMKELEEVLSIRYQLHSKIHPRRSVLVEIQGDHQNAIDSYFENKVLFIPPETRSKSLYASMNELYVEGEGWMETKEFINKYPDQYTDSHSPVVRTVNANYIEIGTARLGQADMSPFVFEHMMKKTKEYNLSFADKKEPVDAQIEAAAKERKEHMHKNENQKNLDIER